MTVSFMFGFPLENWLNADIRLTMKLVEQRGRSGNIICVYEVPNSNLGQDTYGPDIFYCSSL